MAAAHGSTEAQDILETMYVRQFKDPGVPRDYSEAMKWLVKAAEQGSPGAQDLLGWMYCKGQGVPEDYAEAAKWFRKAAEQGYAAAQRDLAILYFRGEGVPQDFAEAASGPGKPQSRDTHLRRETSESCMLKVKVCPRTMSNHISGTAWRPRGLRERTPALLNRKRSSRQEVDSEQLEKTQDMIREWEEKHRGSEYPHLSSPTFE